MFEILGEIVETSENLLSLPSESSDPHYSCSDAPFRLTQKKGWGKEEIRENKKFGE